MRETCVLGTRGSKLALVQAHQLRDRLAAAGGPAAEVRVLRTTGDRITDRPLSEVGGKGLFTKELDEALLTGRIDLAVHSMKDMATRLPDGIAIAAVLPREDPADMLITRDGLSLATLATGALVGTASLRRQAQMLAARPDLRVGILRGNVDTRLKKLADGKVDATILARAGLNRLGLSDPAWLPMSTAQMLPAVAQGAIAVTVRRGDGLAAHLSVLQCAETADCVTAERALLAGLDGSCRTPIAGLATVDGERLSLDGLVAAEDGSAICRRRLGGNRGEAAAIGRELAAILRRTAPDLVSAASR